MLKRVRESFENPDGFKAYDGCLTNKPCLLGIFPRIEKDKAFIKLIMYMLQIRQRDLIDSDYDINDIPFDILLDTFSDYDVSDIKYNFLLSAEYKSIDEIISTSIPANNVDEAKRLMRNINIISYCNGNLHTGHILINLYARLIDKGYSKVEVEQMLSQIFVLQIVDNYQDSVMSITEIPYATVVTVHDIFDLENTDYYEEEEELNEQNQTMFDSNPFIHIEKRGNNDRRIIYKSFGEGSLSQRKDTHLFNVDYAKAPIINYIMSLYLIKALHMSMKHIEIKDNISLQGEIESIIQKTLYFINQRGKKYDSFNREDLCELNEYLIRDVQTMFKHSIPVRTLTSEEKAYLEVSEQGVEAFLCANPSLDLDTKLYNMKRQLKIIFIMDNNTRTNEDKDIDTYDSIKKAIANLGAMYKSFVEYINKVIIPEELTPRLHQELTNYLTTMLDRAKSIATNSRFQQILDEYGDSEIRKSFKV